MNFHENFYFKIGYSKFDFKFTKKQRKALCFFEINVRVEAKTFPLIAYNLYPQSVIRSL